jgi:manganese-transporting P-type ATPase
MCGDGTNDVSALKQAHVGVSIISNPALEKRIDGLRMRHQHLQRERLKKQVDTLVATGKFSKASAERFCRVNEIVDETADDELNALLQAERQPPPASAPASAPAAAALNARSSTSVTPASGAGQRSTLQEELTRRMAELEKDSGDLGGNVMVALGDASIASPFTSKQPSPAACLDILRQVRQRPSVAPNAHVALAL